MIISVVRHLRPIPLHPGADDVIRPLDVAIEDNVSELKSSLREHHDLGFTSPYVRCRDTAAYVNRHADSWYEVPELRESPHYGQETVIRSKLLSAVETMFDLRDRVARFLDELENMNASSALVVTHGDVVNAFRWCIEGHTLDEFKNLYRNVDNFIEFGSVFQFDTINGTTTRTNLGKEPRVMTEFTPIHERLIPYRAVLLDVR